MTGLRLLAIGAMLAPAIPCAARAQGAAIEVGRYFEGDDWTTFRAGLERPLWGPLSVAMYGTHLRASSALGERLWGAGVDLGDGQTLSVLATGWNFNIFGFPATAEDASLPAEIQSAELFLGKHCHVVTFDEPLEG